MAAKGYTVEGWSFQRPDCILNGVQLLPREKPRSAVLLLHGFSMNRNLLKPYAERLAGKGHFCIAYDARGHGKSGGRLDFPAMVEDIGAIADTLRKEQGIMSVGLLGQSMGGLVSAIAAARFKSISAVAMLSGWTDLSSHWHNLRRRVRLYPKVARVLYRMTKREAGGVSWRIFYRPLLAYRGMTIAPSAMDYAKKIRVPFLSIHGATDMLIPFESAREFYEAVASEKKELMALDADHDLCVTHLTQVAPVVLRFFDRWL